MKIRRSYPCFPLNPRFYLFILYNVMNYIVVLINVRYSSSIIGCVIVNSFGNSIQGESLLMIYQVEKHLRIVNIVSLWIITFQEVLQINKHVFFYGEMVGLCINVVCYNFLNVIHILCVYRLNIIYRYVKLCCTVVVSLWYVNNDIIILLNKCLKVQCSVTDHLLDKNIHWSIYLVYLPWQKSVIEMFRYNYT